MTGNIIKNQGLDGILYVLPERIARVAEKLPMCIKGAVYELRLRVN
ncbi:MAG: hypothetical protein IKL94_03625 [Clostridia bacterium]|nr:hypothetical protein [Clostridia bacterium]